MVEETIIVSGGNWGQDFSTLFSVCTNENKNKTKIPHDVLAYCASSPVVKVLDIAVLLSRDHFRYKIVIYPNGVNDDSRGAIPDCPKLGPHLPHHGLNYPTLYPYLPHNLLLCI